MVVVIDEQINQYIFTATNIESLLTTQLNRTILFENAEGVNVKLAFMHYDRVFEEKVCQLEMQNGVNLQKVLVNMYAFFRKYNVQNDEIIHSQIVNDAIQSGRYKSYKVKSENIAGESYQFFKDGVLEMRQTFNEKGVLSFIEYYTNEYINEREEYDHLGILFKRSIIKNGIIESENYYRQDGSRYLVKRFAMNSAGELKTYQLQLFLENNMEIFEFEDEWGLWDYFLKLLIDGKTTLLTSDLVDQYQLILEIDSEDIYKAFFVHGFNQRKNSLFGINEGTLKDIIKQDAIVYPTDGKKNDVIKKHGFLENIFYIPPLVQGKDLTITLSETLYSNRIITLLSDQDVIELEMAIRAFRVVVDVIPEAELFIYGIEILTKDLGELISLLDLDDNIFIKNGTVDMNEIYRVVAGSMFIKQNVNSEMQMIQSLFNGCPVISYNFNYVVNEIIIDQKNGYLVKEGSVKYLAKSMIELLSHPNMESMRQSSILSSKRYNSNSFLKFWDYFTDKLITQSSQAETSK